MSEATLPILEELSEPFLQVFMAHVFRKRGSQVPRYGLRWLEDSAA